METVITHLRQGFSTLTTDLRTSSKARDMKKNLKRGQTGLKQGDLHKNLYVHFYKRKLLSPTALYTPN